MSKCNLSADHLMRVADIAKSISAIEKMEMFLNYAKYEKIDMDKTSQDELDSLIKAFDCGVGSGVLWLFNKLGSEAIGLFDKSEKNDDGSTTD